MINIKKRYYLSAFGIEKEVTEEDFIRAEREAGFYPKHGCGPVATGGFGTGVSGFGLGGRIEYIKEAI
jgi:hypothetical protein